jgi:hypothetical protein
MMKKLMVGLVLVGGFLLVSHLTYAQDAQPTAGSDNSVNQADSNILVRRISLLMHRLIL